MADLRSILTDPNYTGANAATKRAIFERYSAQDPNYVNANEATKQAIRAKYGVSEMAAAPVMTPEEQALAIAGGGGPAEPAPAQPFNLPGAVAGGAETLATLLTGGTTGLLGYVAGGGAGLLEQALAGRLGTPEAANYISRRAAQGAQQYTWQPRTPEAQAGLELIGETLGQIPVTPPTAAAAVPALSTRQALAATRQMGTDVAAELPLLGRARVRAAEPQAAMPVAPSIVPTARKAAEGGLGSTRAMRVLAEEAAPDPRVLESAQRLGIEEYLQPDHITSSQAFRELSQAVKSTPGSQLRAAEMAGLEQVGRRADDLINEIGGTTDLSQLNQSVRNNLDETRSGLMARESQIYDMLRENIPAQTRGEASTILSFIEKRAADLDGAKNLSPLEKEIVRRLTPKEIKNEAGEVVEIKNPTYALIDDTRKLIGEATNRKGAFGDKDSGQAKNLYGLISEDQFALAESVGMGADYKAANALTVMRKGFEDDLIALFGKQLDQSLVSKLETATMALSKGDAEKISKILKAIPEEMRQRVTASALNVAFGKATQNGRLNFNTYANWYQGLLRNKQAYTALMSNLPRDARKLLADLYRVSESVRKATRERITTGRIAAVQQELKGADSLLERIYSSAKRYAISVPLETATTTLGLPGAGTSAALAAGLATASKSNPIKAADALLASPEFQVLAKEAVKPNPDPAVLQKAAKGSAFSKYAKSIGLPENLQERVLWLQSAIQGQQLNLSSPELDEFERQQQETE